MLRPDRTSIGASRHLLHLKAGVLLHDPPHKMWAIYAGRNHQDEARQFAKLVLEGTRLEEYTESVPQRLIDAADSLAASFDRWFLSIRKSVRGFLHYSYIHNIFNPEIRQPVSLPAGVNVIVKAREVAKLVNDYLRQVEAGIKSSSEEKLLIALYNTLYLTLEPLWYFHGLPPSLADTRAPTHTVFDHNYAAASVSNIVSEGGIDGYYVILDFPGVQKFIRGRKAGDLWVSSWMLSNIMWRVGYEVAEEWGLDVILTPSPRLNPYAFKGLISTITGNGYIYTVRCTDDTTVQKICDLASKIYGLRIEDLWSQPLIPATMTLLLPRAHAGSTFEVSERLLRAYKKAWRELYELVIDRLEKSGEPLSEFLLGHLKNIEKAVAEPPQGLSIAVVDLRRVAMDLEECVLGGRDEACGKLNLLSINRRDLKEVAEAVVSGGNSNEVDEVLKAISRKLLYHLIVTRGLALAKNYGTLVNGVPRALWYYSEEDERLEGVSELDANLTCSLCGDEPSALRLDKVFRSRERGYEDDYSFQTWKTIKGILGRELTEEEKRGFRKFLKPGEVLGPYCLFKRATYLALRDIASFLSTDDVALMRASHLLSKRYAGLLDRLAQSLEKIAGSVGKCRPSVVIKQLYSYDRLSVKDIGELALECETNYDKFISLLEGHLMRVCTGGFTQTLGFRDLFNYTIDLLGVDERLSQDVEHALLARVDAGVFRKLCGSLLPQVSYAILRGDADDIGKLLSGLLPMNLESYAGALVKALKESGEAVGSAEVLADTERGYEASVRLSKALGFDGMVVLPAWHSSVSVSLIVSAVDDYKDIKRWDGMLIYSGGDDVLALVPVHSAIVAVRDLRNSFTGDYFKRIGGIIVASSVVTGRSFSVRFANLKDLMSHEVDKAYELLESLPKRVWWMSKRGTGTVLSRKDSLVLSDSRSGAVSLLPNFVSRPDSGSFSSYKILLMLSLAVALGSLSKNLPEDLEEFVGEAPKALDSEGFRMMTTHILQRNLRLADDRLRGMLVGLLGDTPHEVVGCVGDAKKCGTEEARFLPMELYVNALRVLRRYL